MQKIQMSLNKGKIINILIQDSNLSDTSKNKSNSVLRRERKLRNDNISVSNDDLVS